jgi:transcriptional regulator with XRE-family HTH domain
MVVARGEAMAGSRQRTPAWDRPSESFGSILKQRRLAEDRTQADLARQFNVSQQTIGSWERGERPQGRFFAALTQYLDLADEHELVSVLDRDTRPAGALIAFPGPKPADEPEPDSATVRRLMENFVERSRAGSLSREEAEVYREAIRYFTVRMERGEERDS